MMTRFNGYREAAPARGPLPFEHQVARCDDERLMCGADGVVSLQRRAPSFLARLVAAATNVAPEGAWRTARPLTREEVSAWFERHAGEDPADGDAS